MGESETRCDGNGQLIVLQDRWLSSRSMLCEYGVFTPGGNRMKFAPVAAAFLIETAAFASNLPAQEKVDLSRLALPAGLVAAGTDATRAALVCFYEGPAVDAEGNVFFSDIVSNLILKMNQQGQISVFRSDSGRTNGNAFDAEGRLISCEGSGLGAGGRRRIVRTHMKTGETMVLTEWYNGKRYNSPNDVCVDAVGRIWFTDPRYGDRTD